MVALRVKKPFTTGPNAYQLKGGDHSVLIPVSGSGASKRTPGRVAGLKVDPARVPISASATKLRSLSQQPQFLLDGQVALDTIALTNDEFNTAAGINLTVQLYSDFYKDQAGNILIAANGSKLIKRQTAQAGMLQGPAYVDQSGAPIRDATGQIVYMYTDPKTGYLSSPIKKDQPSAKLSLARLDSGFFRVLAPASIQEQLRQTLFKNQTIEVIYEADASTDAAGLADFELVSPMKVDLQPLLSPQIKFPVENPQNVIYDYNNRGDFTEDNIHYAAVAGNPAPINGAAQIATILKLSRSLRNDPTSGEIITGSDVVTAIRAIENQVKSDFNGQLQFKYTHIRSNGTHYEIDNSADFYQIKNLRNGDQIQLKLMASDPELVFREAPDDLLITISNLLVDAPDRARLQHLRVEQSGTENGRGSFRVLVHDPKQPSQDPGVLLKGWKFLVRA